MSNLELEQEQELEFLFESEEDGENFPDESEYEENDEEFFYEDRGDMSYGERFYEVASRESESSYEFERGMGEILDEMEREYFWKKLKRWGKKAYNAANKLTGGNLKGLLKTAANSFLPGSGAALTALGMETADDREAWDGFANFSREAFENLADEVSKNGATTNTKNLGALANMASLAMNKTIKNFKNRTSSSNGNGNVHRITARKGDTIIIKLI